MANSNISECGERLFAAFQQALPLAAPRRGGKSETDEVRRRVDSGLARFYESAREERQRMRLGIVGRARVAFDLQRRLLRAGYPATLAKQVVFALLVAAFSGR